MAAARAAPVEAVPEVREARGRVARRPAVRRERVVDPGPGVPAERVMHPLGGDDIAANTDDPSILALDVAARQVVASVFAKRARSELRVAAAFARITIDLVETGSDPPVLELAARAVGDEVRHASLWLSAASRYRGSDLPWPEPGSAELPTYEGAEPWLLPALRVVGMTCINETIASVRLRDSIEAAAGAVVRDAMRAILADEIHHARIGWAYLASPRLTPEIRAAVSTWLVRLLRANLGALFDDVESSLSSDALSAHGIPSAAQTRQVAAAAVHEIVLPGFAHVGIDVAEAAEWARVELSNPSID
jgi:hypothetical protein